MENATHTIQVAFEGALLLTGIFYILFWMGGHKLKNRQALGLFAIGFAVLLGLDVLRSFLPGYLFLIVCATPFGEATEGTPLQTRCSSQITVCSKTL